MCAFIDAEHALDTEYARRLGVELEDLLVSQPDCGEQALEIVDTLVRTGAIDLIVVDSVAALTPRAEIEGDMGDAHMGLQARLMSQALRKLTAVISRTTTRSSIFINQLRQKIGVVYGNPETTTGGNALKFYCSVRLDIRRKKAIKRGEEIDRQRGARSRSSRTSWRRRSARRSSRSCTAPASTSSASWSTPPRSSASSRSRAPGTRTTAPSSARAATRCSRTSTSTRRWPQQLRDALVKQAKLFTSSGGQSGHSGVAS